MRCSVLVVMVRLGFEVGCHCRTNDWSELNTAPVWEILKHKFACSLKDLVAVPPVETCRCIE